MIGDLPRARALAEAGIAIVGDPARHPRLCWIWTQATGGSFADGAEVETVQMRYQRERVTACLSSQVGCALGCVFCASGQLGSEGMFGWGGAFNTITFVDPKEDMVGIMMSQLRPNNHLNVRRDFQTLVYQALVGSPAVRSSN